MRVVFRVTLAFLLLSLCLVPASYARHRHHSYVSVSLGVWPSSYYYGPYYYPYYDPYYYPVYTYPGYTYPGYTYPAYTTPVYTTTAPRYAAVAAADYQPVVVNGATYYVNNGVYYIYTEYGYQAVPPPAGAKALEVQTTATTTTSPSSADEDSITINIPNKNGGYTPVVIKKTDKGFVGPQGEFYAEFPKVSQLQTVYGK